MLVQVLDDFDVNKIVESGQCFRCAKINGWYRFITGSKILYIKPVSENLFDISCSEKDWNDVWKPYFDFQRNYSTIRQSISNDEFLLAAAASGRGIRILKQDPWEVLISFIISQRKSIPAIKQSVETISNFYGKPLQTNCEIVFSFPTPEELLVASDASLCQCGLGYRIPYIQDAARKVCDGKIDLVGLSEKNDLLMQNELKQIKGVGNKVANCVMLFAYGRTSSVPVDTWIKRIIEDKYMGINPFASYGNNAGIMQQYAFYYAQHHKAEVMK